MPGTHIAVPDERAEQLRSFADLRGIGVADAVAVLINHAIETGLMESTLPGFKVSRMGAEVVLAVDGAFEESLTREAAIELAGQLDGSIDAEHPHQIFGVDIGFITGRRGASIKLKHPASGSEKTMAPSVARDLAKILRGVANGSL